MRLHAVDCGARPRRTRGRVTTREQEFTELYLESYPFVYNYVRYRMANDSEAEDIVSEAYLLAARSFERFDPSRAKFSTWVITIAINCMRGYWRKQRPTVDLEEVPQVVFSVVGDESQVDDRDEVDMLLGVLDQEECELVLMKYRDGKRNVDIADELGMNQSTVSTKLFKAIGKMRAVREGYGL